MKKVLGIFLATLSLLGTYSWAQESPMNVTLSPVSLQLEAKPGESVRSSIRIRNNGTETETLKLSVGTFVADETGESPKLIEPNEADRFIKWVTFESDQVDVFPGEWKEVQFTIAVPEDASLSYYYLIYVTQTKLLMTESGTTIAGSPAISVLLQVDSPNTTKELKLSSFTTKNYVVETLPAEFEIEVENTGNTHVAPFGNVFIDGQGKKDLALIPVNSNNNVVLPESKRTYKVTWDDGFPVKGDGFLGFDWDFSKGDRFRIGRYTAHVLLAYDNGERDVAIESVLSFWVFPWKILILGVLISILSLLGLWSSVKKPLIAIKSKLSSRS